MAYIYLASPYSHPDPDVKELRYKQVMRARAEMMMRGLYVYSPIVDCHPMSIAHLLPGDFEYWKNFDHIMLERSAAMCILRLAGWKESEGLKGEVAYALAKNIPLMYMHWEDEDAETQS
jgi:hypothetical protein